MRAGKNSKNSLDEAVKETLEYIKSELKVVDSVRGNPSIQRIIDQLPDRIKLVTRFIRNREGDNPEIQAQYCSRVSDELRALTLLNALYKPQYEERVKAKLLELSNYFKTG